MQAALRRRLFPLTQALEESIFLGDLSLKQYLRGMASARHPLLTGGGDRFEATPLERLVHEGRQDHIALKGINRWLGGTHLSEGAPVWRWNELHQTLSP